MAKEEKVKWYKSKTKWAALLIGLSPILATVGGYLNNSIDVGTVLMQLSAEIGIVLGVFGIRDWNIINGVKK